VTIQDLRQSSQDISAFYLGNIYQVLADPNVTRSSIPAPVAKPPSFSPSRYTVWVNTLWFLSLLMSLSCALWATSLHQWARQYLRRSQPARCHPEKRARMRAFYAEGVDSMHIPWAVEGLPTLLHLSLFLFFGGVAIFLFDVDREVFYYVVWWIGLFCLVYGMITVLPLIRQDSPYNSPLSTPAWYLYVTMTYVTVKILSFVIIFCAFIWYFFCFCCCCAHDYDTRMKVWMLTPIKKLGKRYRRRMLGSVEKAAEEAVSERLSNIDVRILDWTITTLGDDDSLKNFFETIPGFFNSKLMKHLKGDFPEGLYNKYRDALNGFLDRTWSSNSVNDSEKLRRLDIVTNAMSLIHRSTVSSIHRDEMPPHITVARILLSVQERDDNWVRLASRVFGLSGQDLRENLALGDDSVLLAILIHVTRQSHRSQFYHYSYQEVLEVLPKFDIRKTLPRLQHEFCTLWNEIDQEAQLQHATDPGRHSSALEILYEIRHHYVTLHQGTDAAPTLSDLVTTRFGIRYPTPYSPFVYPFCHIASHHPDPTRHRSVSTPMRSVIEPPSSSNPTTTNETRAISRGPYMTPPTNPVHSSSRRTRTSASVESGGYRGSRGRSPARNAPIAPPRSRRTAASDTLELSSRRTRLE
jgi:hypothetical protein